jgi:WD40 repeat protein
LLCATQSPIYLITLPSPHGNQFPQLITRAPPHTIVPRKPVSSPSHSNIPHKPIPLQHALNQATARRTLTPSRSIGYTADTAFGARPVPNASPSYPIVLVDSKALQPVPIQNSPPSPSATPPNLILQDHTDWVHGAAFSPDGNYIVSGSDDRTLIVWDAQTGDLGLGPVKIHANPVYCVAWSPDGRKIASGSYDKTVMIWDSATGQVVAGPFKGHSDAIESVSFSPNGKQIASGSQDNTIRVWDAQTGDLLVGPLAGHTKRVNTVAFSGDGK